MSQVESYPGDLGGSQCYGERVFMKDLLLSLELKTPEELGDLLIGAVLSLKQSDKIVEDVDPQEKFTLEYMIPGLLELGADVNLIREQEEPFHLYHKSVMEHAVLKGRLDLLRLLVSYGGDLEYRDKFGMSLLGLAIIGGHYDIVRYLLECGVTVGVIGIQETRSELSRLLELLLSEDRWGSKVSQDMLKQYLKLGGILKDPKDVLGLLQRAKEIENSQWGEKYSIIGVMDAVWMLVESNPGVIDPKEIFGLLPKLPTRATLYWGAKLNMSCAEVLGCLGVGGKKADVGATNGAVLGFDNKWCLS